MTTPSYPPRAVPLLFPVVLAFVVLFPHTARAAAATFDPLLLSVPALAGGAPASAKATIGSAGGTLAAGGASVVFPPSALSSSTAVSLSTVHPQTYGFPASGRAFSLSAAADCFLQPVQLRLNVGGPNRTMLVAMTDTTASDGQSSTTMPFVVEGAVSGGVLTVTLPLHEDCAAAGAQPAARTLRGAEQARRTITFWAVSGFASVRTTHFVLVYPVDLMADKEDMPQTILDYAEEAYTKLAQLGFVFNNAFSWPFYISVSNNLGERNAETNLPLTGKRYTSITLNGNICTSAKLQLLKATIGHEFFHAVQTIYDPRPALVIRHPWMEPVYLWLSEASSVWFENTMLDSATYVADIFLSNLSSMADGLETYLNHAHAQSLGYWASGFLRYLAGPGGKTDALVLNAWQQVHGQSNSGGMQSDLRALIDADGSATDLSSQWTTYIGKLVTGTTGFSGWEQPGSANSWYYAAQPVSNVSKVLTPFSASKWTYVFNTATPPNNYAVAVTTYDPNVNYALYYRTSGTAPFQLLGNVAYGSPVPITPAANSQYVLCVTNSDTGWRYRTQATASARVGPAGACLQCPDVPADAVMTQGGSGTDYWRAWANPANGFQYYAFERHSDAARTKLTRVDCKWPQNYQARSAIIYNDAGKVVSLEFYDTNSAKDGVWRMFYDDGTPWNASTWSHGVANGPWTLWNADGSTKHWANYVNGQKNGTFVVNPGSGSQLTCVYELDVLVSGPEAQCNAYWN